MKNTEKNSQKINLFRYLLFFLLLSLLIIGGTYWYFTWPDRQLAKDIAEIKNAKFEYKNLDDEQIVQYNEHNIQEEEYLKEKLKDPDNKLTQKQRKAFSKLLKELTSNIDKELNQQILEEKDEEERQKIILEILKKSASLNKLDSKIESLPTLEKRTNYIKEQDEWFDRFYPNSFEITKEPHEEAIEVPKGEKIEEDDEITNKIDEFMKHFYDEFMKVKKLNIGKAVQPLLTIEGEKITLETPQKKIDEKKRPIKKTKY